MRPGRQDLNLRPLGYERLSLNSLRLITRQNLRQRLDFHREPATSIYINSAIFSSWQGTKQGTVLEPGQGLP